MYNFTRNTEWIFFDDVDSLGKNINTVKETAGTSLDTGKEGIFKETECKAVD